MTDNHPSNENVSQEARELAQMLCSAIERAREAGYDDGFEDGYAEGLKIGQGSIPETAPVLFVQHSPEEAA